MTLDRSASLPVFLAPGLFLLSLLGLGAVSSADPRHLLQEGHAAFARGDYGAAASLYERAEIHSTNPAEVAFYLAGAKYHLALPTPGPSPELIEAEKLYRCCLDSSDPHRPLALYGLGNCLLHRAGPRDAASLRTAILCYDQCLQSAGEDAALVADARYNREKARLLLLQMQPPSSGSPEDKTPPNGTDKRPPQADPHSPEATGSEQGSEGTPAARTVGAAVKPEPGTKASKTDAPPPPGRGNLEPIPDEVEALPLSARDAAEHLESAAKQVIQERYRHHRRSERSTGAGVKDW